MNSVLVLTCLHGINPGTYMPVVMVLKSQSNKKTFELIYYFYNPAMSVCFKVF
jgi:hypothetical protein